MRAWTDWLEARPTAHRAPTLIVVALFAVLCLAATALAFPPAVPFVGAGAGVALFLVGYGWWATVLPAATADALDLKQRYPLTQRRIVAAAALILWFTLLLLLGRLLPDPIVGTLNVVVLCLLYLLWKATPAEQAEALAAYEAAQSEQPED